MEKKKQVRYPKLRRAGRGIRIPSHLKEILEFLLSMQYGPRELMELSTDEVEFIRERSHELKINGFDELIDKLNLGIYYDKHGQRHWKSDEEDKDIDNWWGDKVKEL